MVVLHHPSILNIPILKSCSTSAKLNYLAAVTLSPDLITAEISKLSLSNRLVISQNYFKFCIVFSYMKSPSSPSESESLLHPSTSESRTISLIFYVTFDLYVCCSVTFLLKLSGRLHHQTRLASRGCYIQTICNWLATNCTQEMILQHVSTML